MSQEESPILFITGCSARVGLKLKYLVLVACLIAGAPLRAQAQAPRSPTPAPVKGALAVETVAKALEHPWGLTFLPDGRMLVTERPGRLRLLGSDGKLSEPLRGVPEVYARGQGG